jgi:hypothetical protein
LEKLTLADAGTYSVIVTNPEGKATSLGISVIVQVSAPAFSSVVHSNGTLAVSWSTAQGRSYQFQLQNAFSGPWVNLGAPLTAMGESLSATLAIGPSSQQFYRVILLP